MATPRRPKSVPAPTGSVGEAPIVKPVHVEPPKPPPSMWGDRVVDSEELERLKADESSRIAENNRLLAVRTAQGLDKAKRLDEFLERQAAQGLAAPTDPTVG